MRKKYRLFHHQAQNPPVIVVQTAKTSFFRRFVNGFGLTVLIVLGLCVAGAMMMGHRAPAHVPHAAVLTMNLNGDLPEYNPYSDWDALVGEPTLALQDTVDTIDLAARDARIKGIFLNIGDGEYTQVGVDTLRRALKRFQAAGKFVDVYADGLTEYGNGMNAYLLASVGDYITVQPGGSVSLTGYVAEVPYVKGLLDKLGIRAEISQREKFKTAPESMLRADISPEQKETFAYMLDTATVEFLANVAGDRNLDMNALRGIMQRTPMSANDAANEGLIDDVAQESEAKDATLSVAGDDAEYMDMVDYADGRFDELVKQVEHKDKTIAILYMNGMIVGGHEDAPDMVVAAIYADALLSVAEDADVKTLVIRIDSPGGTPQGSEKIRGAIERVKESGKKVIVSMGNVAASGGYWVSVDADSIYVQPMTITGSIGVFGGKYDASGLLKKLDVHVAAVAGQDQSTMWSVLSPYTPAGAAANERMLDTVYQDFMVRVADGRHIEPKQVHELAQGKVYIGRDAIRVKLADKMGDFAAALDDAAMALGAKDRFGVDVVDYTPEPEPASLIAQFFGARVLAMVRASLVPHITTPYIPKL